LDTRLPSLTIELEESNVTAPTYKIVLKADTNIELDTAMLRLYWQLSQKIYED